MCYIDLRVLPFGTPFKLELPYGSLSTRWEIPLESPTWFEIQQAAADWMLAEMGRPSRQVPTHAAWAAVKAEYLHALPQEAREWQQRVKRDVALDANGGQIALELPTGGIRVIGGDVSRAEKIRRAAIWLVDVGIKQEPPEHLRGSATEVFYWALNQWRLREYLKLAKA
mgnify:CR=1 FL=1